MSPKLHGYVASGKPFGPTYLRGVRGEAGFAMAYLGLSSLGGQLVADGAPYGPAEWALGEALKGIPAGAPVVILIHGFRYHPGSRACDPRGILYGARDRMDGVPWPAGLGFSAPTTDDGLCIGLSWEGVAEPEAHPLRNLFRFEEVYERAPGTARHLAQILTAAAAFAPQRRVDILAHSLGARIALRSLPLLQHSNLGRVILLGAAVYETEVLEMLAANRANPGAEFFNLTARENDPFDFLFERFAPRRSPDDRALGAGTAYKGPNWLDIQIDNPLMVGCLQRRGVQMSQRQYRVNHWGFYLRGGALDLYRRLIRDRENWAMPLLRFEQMNVQDEPRWTRLRPRLALGI